MFNAFLFPHSDFNKINLDWILHHLPVEYELSEFDSNIVTIVGYTALLMDEYVMIDAHLYAANTVNTNSAIFTIPNDAKESYQTAVLGSNANLFIDANTNTVYTDAPFSGHIYVKMLFKVKRGY